MAKTTSFVALLIPVIVGSAGCSNNPGSPQLRPGELSAGTSRVSIDGRQPVSSELVTCSPAGPQTAITTGEAGGGTTSTIDTTDGLVPLFVELRNVDGFSGSSWHELDDQPTVTVTNRTYLIEGTAQGYGDENPSDRVEEKFSIQVAC